MAWRDSKGYKIKGQNPSDASGSAQAPLSQGSDNKGDGGIDSMLGSSGDGSGGIMDQDETPGAAFRKMNLLPMLMSKFVSPSGPSRMPRLKEHAQAFISHPVVEGTPHYDPHMVDGMQSLFHGTCQSHLSSFYSKGITVRDNHRMEFSTTGCFYVAGSMTHAFEHVYCSTISSIM